MSKERGKIRGFFFEIDGGDETLQEGLRNFGMALGRALSGPPRPAKALPAPGKGRPQDEADDADAEDDAPDLFTEADSNGNGSTSKKKSSGNRKPVAMPKIIDLDLKGTKGLTLHEFAGQKNPQSLSDKALVSGSWLKNYGGVDEITPDHVFTCFKIMDWTPHPSSYTTLLADMKGKQKSLDKGAGTGAYKINLHGENLVAKMGVEA